MNKYAKAGLTALAGSLVAVSAAQADWSVSGSGKMSYTSKNGSGNPGQTGGRFGMDKDITVSGSMEMDNGWAVSSSHTLEDGAGSQSFMTVDMGAMGALTYNLVDGAVGISKIDDTLPTADEEVWNGLGTVANPVTGRVKHTSANGFNYNVSSGMINVDVGFIPQGSASRQTGSVGESATTPSSESSIAITATPMDGLTIYAGTGEKANATIGQTDDLQVLAAKYSWGPVTVGYTQTEIDVHNSATDYDTDGMSIAYAINDDLSISYGERTVDIGGVTADEEQSGISIGYSMGGMTIKAHANAVDNTGGVATADFEHTEIAVSFAF